MEIVKTLFIIIAILTCLICIFMILKNIKTCIQRIKIIEAIYEYNIYQIDNHKVGNQIAYNVMECYNNTLFRIKDFGYKNIVPKDVFDKIEPFIVD